MSPIRKLLKINIICNISISCHLVSLVLRKKLKGISTPVVESISVTNNTTRFNFTKAIIVITFYLLSLSHTQQVFVWRHKTKKGNSFNFIINDQIHNLATLYTGGPRFHYRNVLDICLLVWLGEYSYLLLIIL